MVRVTGLEWDSFVKGMAVGKGPGRFMVATRARRRAKAEREKSELPFQGTGVRFMSKRFSSRRTPEPMQGDTGRGT